LIAAWVFTIGIAANVDAIDVATSIVRSVPKWGVDIIYTTTFTVAMVCSKAAPAFAIISITAAWPDTIGIAGSVIIIRATTKVTSEGRQF